MESLQGNFLLATPQMPDPRFQEQVVYICSHNEEGCMGVVINQPSNHNLSEVLKSANISIGDMDYPPVYIGGPVDMESAFFIYSSEYEAANYLPVSSGVNMSREPRILQDIGRGEGPIDFLFALGYAGWSAGQLEAELSLNGWLTLPASYEILFKTEDQLKWRNAALESGIDISLYCDKMGFA